VVKGFNMFILPLRICKLEFLDFFVDHFCLPDPDPEKHCSSVIKVSINCSYAWLNNFFSAFSILFFFSLSNLQHDDENRKLGQKHCFLLRSYDYVTTTRLISLMPGGRAGKTVAKGLARVTRRSSHLLFGLLPL
jgi:hypothetical protein